MKKILFILVAILVIGIPTRIFAYTPSPADWRDQVIYMVMLDRFYDGDSSNDNYNGNYNPSSPGGVHGGDIKGVTQKLDYLKTLGIKAIWISPVPTNDGQYHGYAAVNWQQVDPRLGTMTDLQNLVQQAHARGMYVFLDVVCNHMGFRVTEPSSNWNYPAGYTLSWANSNNKYSPTPFDSLSSFHNYGNINNFGDTTQVELGWLSGLNDIKTEDTTVQNALINIWEWWIQQTDCDGFRIDTFKHVNVGFWQAFCPAIRSYAASLGKNNFLMFGEVWDSDAKCGYYTGTKAGGPYILQSVLYYPMYYTLNNVFAYGQNTKQLDDEYSQLINYDTTSWDYLATFIDNHDNARFLSPSHANNDYNKLKLALTFLLTSRGIPIIYYGTEQGFYGETDPYCREDMWAGQFKDANFAGQDSFNPNFTLFQFTSTLLYLRSNYAPLRRGTFTSRWNNSSSAGIYAYSRIYNGQEIVVVLNTATSTQTTKNGSTGITTTFPQNTILTNLLNTTDTVIVGTNGVGTNQISVTMPAQSIKILSSYSVATIPPIVLSSSPTTGQTNVPLNPQISVSFSVPMLQSSVESAFSTNPVTSGNFDWNGQTMIYTPTSPLIGNQVYTVTIATTAYSVMSVNLQSPYTFSFTTRPQDDFTPPIISNFFPGDGSTVSNTQKPNIQATLTDTGSGINPNTIVMTLDYSTVSPSYDSSSGIVSYTPAFALNTGLHAVTLDVQDNCANSAVQAIHQFNLEVTKIMDGNFAPGEWSTTELRLSNSYDPWGTNNIVQLYVSGDSQYLYIGVAGTVDISGYNNVIGVYVDVPTIQTNIDQTDHFQGITAQSTWDPDFMYAVVQMENDPNGGGSVRKINLDGTTTEIGNVSSEDCGALSASKNSNGIGGIEFRIPWSITNGANPYTTIKVGAWMGWANSKTSPTSGLGGGSRDELGNDTDNNALTIENPWTGTASNPVPVELSNFSIE